MHQLYKNGSDEKKVLPNMFQTAILGSSSTQLKASEVQGLAIWIFLWFLLGVGGQKRFMAL